MSPRRPRVAVRPGRPTRPAPATLAALAATHGFTLVHYSSEYVFDGTADRAHRGRAALPARRLRPVQGRRRHRRRARAAPLPRAYVVGDRRRARTSSARWRPSPPTASRRPWSSDQVGRLTFASELARATRHLIDSGARSAPTTSPTAARHVVGRDRARGLHALAAAPPTTCRRRHRGVRRRGAREGQALRPPPAHSPRCRWRRSAPPASSPRTRSPRSTATSPHHRLTPDGRQLAGHRHSDAALSAARTER